LRLLKILIKGFGLIFSACQLSNDFALHLFLNRHQSFGVRKMGVHCTSAGGLYPILSGSALIEFLLQ